MVIRFLSYFFFFFNDTATTEIYTLSLHDALPISLKSAVHERPPGPPSRSRAFRSSSKPQFLMLPMFVVTRSEEHTSELQSQSNLVCRLLLEKKNKVEPQINLKDYKGVMQATLNDF